MVWPFEDRQCIQCILKSWGHRIPCRRNEQVMRGLFQLQGLPLAQSETQRLSRVQENQLDLLEKIWSVWYAFDQMSEDVATTDQKPSSCQIDCIRIFSTLSLDTLIVLPMWFAVNILSPIIMWWTWSMLFWVVAFAGRPDLRSLWRRYRLLMNSAALSCTAEKSEAPFPNDTTMSTWMFLGDKPFPSSYSIAPRCKILSNFKRIH